MTEPLISILVPAYNRADTIEQCLRSILTGGHQRFEVIFSDNGSKDDTVEIARRVIGDDPRFLILESETNLGPLPNWKRCLDHAQGEFIHWLWSDDWIAPGFYACLLAGMLKGGVRIGFSAATLIDPLAGKSHDRYRLDGVLSNRDQLIRLGLTGVKLPKSPAAGLLPVDSVRKHFTDSIPDWGDLQCNRRAIGCDARMILGALLDHGAAYFQPKPMVFFRESSSSISHSTARVVLRAHYAWARMTWARQHGLPRSWCWLDMVRLAQARRFDVLTAGIRDGLL